MSCEAMASCMRLKIKRERSNELELTKEAEEGSNGGDRQRPISSPRNTKRVKNDYPAGLDSAQNREDDRVSENVGACEICKASSGIDAFVTGCSHVYCRGCLKEHVEKVINSQMSVTQLTFQDLSLYRILCPTLSCKEELSQSELVDLVGPKSVGTYERWLGTNFDHLYRPSLMKYRIECISGEMCADQATPTVILASKLSDLTIGEVRHALKVRGVERKFWKRECIRELLKSVGLEESEGNKAVWLCTTCNASWCATCGRKISVVVGPKGDGSKCHKDCEEGKQRYEIYKSLVELEDACKVYIHGRRSPIKMWSKPIGVGNTIWADGVGDTIWADGVGDTIWEDGTGFGGESTDNHKYSRNMQDAIKKAEFSRNMQDAAKKVELDIDNQVEKQLVFLTEVLSMDVGNKHGRSSPLTVATCALIGWENILSRLLEQLATNDSMLDISERSSLYLNMVSLVGAIQLHRELRPLLLGCPKQDKSRDETGPDQLVGPEQTQEGEDHALDKDNTLVKKMGNIYRQAQVMLQNMPHPDSENGEDVDMSLARELCKCYESLQGVFLKEDFPVVDAIQASQTQGISSRSKGKQQLEIGKEDAKLELSATQYKERLIKMQFRQLCMQNGKGQYKHNYLNRIFGKVTNSECIDKMGIHNHKRMIHLSKEISSLATSLPLEWESSIHLCVDESRLDVLRALIIGPKGTPYQNGLFSFDIFLPPDYPRDPPRVPFLTTGGGKVKFHPSLYKGGKVCLSLLGNWAGPGWVAGKSTLLQVLVSIQSLIFVKDPYYNHPRKDLIDSSVAEIENRKYREIENRKYRERTLSIAILGALRKPDRFFADISREHFRFKQEEVETQCDAWVAAIPKGDARDRIANVAKEVKIELQNLCSSYKAGEVRPMLQRISK